MLESIEGTLKNITFRNPENGFSVLRFTVEGEVKPVTVTGNFPDLSVGESFRMEGEWKTHPKYGKQFACIKSEPFFPESGAGLVAYLGGGLFKGIGEATAKRFSRYFWKRSRSHFGRRRRRNCEEKNQRIFGGPI